MTTRRAVVLIVAVSCGCATPTPAATGEPARNACGKAIDQFRAAARSSGQCSADSDCSAFDMKPVPGMCCVISGAAWPGTGEHRQLVAALSNECGRSTYRCGSPCKPLCRSGRCVRDLVSEVCGRPELADLCPGVESNAATEAAWESLANSACQRLGALANAEGDQQPRKLLECKAQYGLSL